MSVVVGVDGMPRDIKILDGAVEPTLAQSAIENLSKWYFAPAMRGDTPVAMKMNIEFSVGGK
jgi:outer membrane biosynthesis protein TonB